MHSSLVLFVMGLRERERERELEKKSLYDRELVVVVVCL